jgi:2-polyprenyl-6-methoxyphenol hydroxylase-like FAD-dependent oxidoreductase
MTSAIVVGASVAGLLSAQALSGLVDEVVVMERERLTDTLSPRGHVPQGRHLHLLLAGGLDLLVTWFPGIADELERMGAVWIDGTRAWVYQAGGYRAQGDWGRSALSMTRPLLEQVIRRRIAALDNVRLDDGVVVDRVDVSDGRVSGVVVGGVVQRADLVVDCSGRSSRIAHQLESSGDLAPPLTRVTIDCAYASGFLPRSADDFEGTFLVCATSPPTSFRSGAILPVEGDRWIVTLAGVHGDVPGTTEDEVLAFARSLLSPAVAQLVERAGPLSSVASYRFPSSQRRHYEKVRRLLPGFVTLGDAACSFNPIYGQGMACAALQADALGDAVRELGVRSEELPRRYTAGPRKSSTLPGRSPSARTFCIRRRWARRRAGRTRSTATSCGSSRPATPRSSSRGLSTSCSTWWSRPEHWRGHRWWPGCWRPRCPHVAVKPASAIHESARLAPPSCRQPRSPCRSTGRQARTISS